MKLLWKASSISQFPSKSKYNSILTITKKRFFLKYLLENHYIKTDISNKVQTKSDSNESISSVDLKKLLNPDNITINMRDIMTDYKMYHHNYFYIKSEELLYEEKIDIEKQKLQKKGINLPFTETTINFESIWKYLFVHKGEKSYYYKLFFWGLLYYVLGIYAYIKINRIKEYNKALTIRYKAQQLNEDEFTFKEFNEELKEQ